MSESRLHRFLFPQLTTKYLLRVMMIGVLAWLFFSRVVIISHVDGISMEPTVHDKVWMLVWCPAYWHSEPQINDIVTVRWIEDGSIQKKMLLKRVIAVENDNISFINGNLFRNGEKVLEPYVKFNMGWNMPPGKVDAGNVYVVGDNRGLPIREHVQGVVLNDDVIGRALPLTKKRFFILILVVFAVLIITTKAIDLLEHSAKKVKRTINE